MIARQHFGFLRHGQTPLNDSKGLSELVVLLPLTGRGQTRSRDSHASQSMAILSRGERACFPKLELATAQPAAAKR